MSEPALKIKPGTRVLVTGATGFTGENLTRKLVAMNLDVVAISRPTSDLTRFDGLPIQWIRGDVANKELIDQAIQNVQYVFHMVTPFREAKAPDVEFYNVHVLSTQLLAKAALKQPDFQRFVHISTIGIHGHIDNPPADETYRTAPGDIYQETKLEGEIWIREFGKSSGLPVSIVRPSIIYGPGDQRLFKIYKWAYQGWMPLIGSGKNLLHLVHVDDLTDFFIMAATHPKALGETFICGSEHAIHFDDMVAIISKQYNIKVKFLKVPKTLAFFLGDVCEAIFRPLRIEPPIYRRRLAFYTKDRSFNTSKMRSLLGYSTKHSDQEGIAELAQWYLDAGWLGDSRST